MRISSTNRSKFALAMVVMAGILGLPKTGFGQAPTPAMGRRLGQGTFVSPNFILNLDVQVRGTDGAPLKSMAVVTLYASCGLPVSTATTKGTRALFAQLAPGQYYGEVEATGYWQIRETALVHTPPSV